MKKIYLKPSTEMTEIHQVTVIAASDLNVYNDVTEGNDGWGSAQGNVFNTVWDSDN